MPAQRGGGDGLRCLVATERMSAGGSSSPRQSRLLHPPPESPFLPMLGRNLPAVGFLRQMPEPVLDIRDEPLGGDQIPHGIVLLQRLTVAKNGVGHFAIEQDGG